MRWRVVLEGGTEDGVECRPRFERTIQGFKGQLETGGFGWDVCHADFKWLPSLAEHLEGDTEWRKLTVLREG